jgi:adenine-specific DNA-methyltransferase
MTAFQASLELGFQQEPLTVSPAASVAAVEGHPQLVAAEPKGVVYTKPWVVDLILDLSGYRAEDDLAARYAVEPSAGAGAFLLPMVRRLMTSVACHGRSVADARESIRAYELDGDVAVRVTQLVVPELRKHGLNETEARDLAQSWIGVGDYLLASPQDRRADLVVGNPPYIRYDDLPPDALDLYRRLYPTMVGRCDIYVAFIEAGLRQLSEGGTLAFICADRWMRSAYGAELRRMISAAFGVETVIEMHDAPAFEDAVAAYPAVIVIRRAPQAQAVVASAGPGAGPAAGTSLADAVTGLAHGHVTEVPGFTATTVDHWFHGPSPWPALEPHQLHLLQLLEEGFAPLEDENTGTKIGIGVATGADRVFITTDPELVERDRLLPLAMTGDTRQGTLLWSGHYLVDPWVEGAKKGTLVDLDAYPRLRTYLDSHREKLQGRHIARQRPRDWYRTIDPVHHQLTSEPKLYFPDMKLTSNPVLDRGETYPHHNLYYLTSKAWDLEVLGGLLLSRVAQLFIEAYCARMRGGTLRFQAQYLRRIRIPDSDSLPESVCDQLRQAFRDRDRDVATAAAIKAYGIENHASVLAC